MVFPGARASDGGVDVSCNEAVRADTAEADADEAAAAGAKETVGTPVPGRAAAATAAGAAASWALIGGGARAAAPKETADSQRRGQVRRTESEETSATGGTAMHRVCVEVACPCVVCERPAGSVCCSALLCASLVQTEAEGAQGKGKGKERQDRRSRGQRADRGHMCVSPLGQEVVRVCMHASVGALLVCCPIAV
jgi:hypothetical protein